MGKKLYHITLFIFFLACTFQSFGQDKKLEQKENVNESLYEEVQRYIGYEDLIYRYTSVPYDVNVNMNLNGYFVEIGYLLLMFLP